MRYCPSGSEVGSRGQAQSARCPKTPGLSMPVDSRVVFELRSKNGGSGAWRLRESTLIRLSLLAGQLEGGETSACVSHRLASILASNGMDSAAGTRSLHSRSPSCRNRPAQRVQTWSSIERTVREVHHGSS